MIISASCRPDIPAFHAGRFLRRLEGAGRRSPSPYGGPPSAVKLGPGEVAGFVLWTHDRKPLIGSVEPA